MAMVVLISYFSILGVLCVFGWHRLFLTHLYRKFAQTLPNPRHEFDELPRVTVQLPIFNEAFVVERLIDATVALDYPRDRLEIQVLDDSTDETREHAKKRVEYHRRAGTNIAHITRSKRTGYKAGALAQGLAKARGEFVAIFDADFLPKKDFLKQIPINLML